jgi:hypothetical protein
MSTNAPGDRGTPKLGTRFVWVLMSSGSHLIGVQALEIYSVCDSILSYMDRIYL